MTSAALPLIHEAPSFSQKVWLTIAVVALVGLLTAPLPTAWIGLAALAAILLGRGRALVGAGAGLPYWLSLAPYIAGALVGYAISIRPGAAEIRLFGILAGVAASTLVFLAATSPDGARRVAGVMLGITIVATPIMFLVVTPFLLPLDRLPSGLIGWAGALEPIRQLILDQDDVLQRYRLRASGLGTLSAFGVGLTLGPLMTAQTRKTRVLASLVLLYFGVFLLLAGNRGAMLSAAVATVLLFAGRMRWLLVGGVATALGVLLIMSGLALAGSGPGHHFLGVLSSPITDLGSIQRRVEFWDNLFFLLGDFRFTGVGLGVRSVQEIYETYFIPIDPRFSHSHNIFLQTYLEQGPLGLIGLVGLVLIGLVSAWRTLSRINYPDARSAIVSAIRGPARASCGRAHRDCRAHGYRHGYALLCSGASRGRWSSRARDQNDTIEFGIIPTFSGQGDRCRRRRPHLCRVHFAAIRARSATVHGIFIRSADEFRGPTSSCIESQSRRR